MESRFPPLQTQLPAWRVGSDGVGQEVRRADADSAHTSSLPAGQSASSLPAGQPASLPPYFWTHVGERIADHRVWLHTPGQDH